MPEHGLTLLVVKPAHLDADSRGRVRHRQDTDVAALRALLRSAGIPMITTCLTASEDR